VSLFPLVNGAWGLVWLDGRAFHAADGGEAPNEMALRFRSMSREGVWGEETVIDGRICDCCQTSAAITSRGPVIVYRDRSPEEIRDIHVIRLVDGAWTEGTPVHADGWRISACPVNGPAVAARGDRVAVAWFTGADDVAKVNVAFSSDAGATFSAPVRVDEGDPAGRVDIVMLADGSALITWLERADDAARVLVRRVEANGLAGPSVEVARSSDARASGFPRVIEAPDGSLVFAWSDVSGGGSRVRLARGRMGG
jgi:hypothetical protein